MRTSPKESKKIAGYFLMVSVFSLKFLHAESDGKWIAEDSIETEGNVARCKSGEKNVVRKLESCKAIWKDGEGVISGEHYWKVYFDQLDNYGLVGLTNNDNNTDDIFYGGSSSFGKRIRRGHTIGILASFTNDKLKVYFAHNNKLPEFSTEVDAAVFNNIYPVVKFFGGGRATITKETTMPSMTNRRCTTQTQKFVGIEGNWKIANPENVKISGHPLKFYTNGAEARLRSHNGGNLATLNVRPAKTIGQYEARLTIINRIWFKIKDCDGSWSSTTPETTEVGVDFEIEDLEYRLTALLENPDIFVISGAQMSVQKGNMIATFVR